MPKIIENAREKLLEEGMKKLVEEGYSKLNIRETVKSCGIGIGTFYNYFKNKDEFVVAIFIEDWRKAMNIIELQIEKECTLKEKIEKVYLCMNEFLKSYVSVFHEINRLNKGSKEKYCDFKEIYEKVEQILQNEKEKGNLKSELSCKKLSYLIVSNIFSICKDKYITFDELYDSLVI